MSWSDEKEIVKTNRSLLFCLWLLKVFPAWVVFSFTFPVSLFFWIFAPRARASIKDFQNQLGIRHNTYKTILSFSIAIIERMRGWLGKMKYENLIIHDDDLQNLIDRLNQGKGAFLIGSHLGNIELLRSLSSFNRTGVSKNFEVLSIIEGTQTQQFTKTLEKINPDSAFNVIDPTEIGPDTVIKIEEHLEKGGLVVIAGDRTSAHSQNRFINIPFLGKNTNFPYGVFLLPVLLKAPVYFMFGLRTKTATLFPKNNMFIHKSSLDFEENFPRKEREERIKALCKEFVSYLEKYAKEFPYQWYNFYKYWD